MSAQINTYCWAGAREEICFESARQRDWTERRVEFKLYPVVQQCDEVVLVSKTTSVSTPVKSFSGTLAYC